MSVEGEMKQLAAQFARTAQAQQSNLERELAEIEARKAEIVAKRDAIRLMPERAFEFQPKIGMDYQCPRCWMNGGVNASLRTVPSARSREDIFRCNACNFEISVPF